MAYTKNTWKTDDIITADKLNNLESGLDTTVTKVNNLAIGGRNLLLGTAIGFTGVGRNSTNTNFDEQGGKYYLAGGKKVSDLYKQYGSSGYLTISFDWVASGSTISGTFNPIWNNTPWGGLLSSPISPSISNLSGHYEYTVKLSDSGYSTGIATAVVFRQDNLQGNITISNLKLESGNKATDWTPAPEDVPSNDTKLVHNTGTETVAGDKTFTGSVIATRPINGVLQLNSPTVTDLNNLTTSGSYLITNLMLNTPVSMPNGAVVNVSTFDARVTYQVMTTRDDTNPVSGKVKTWVRGKFGSTWAEWRRYSLDDTVVHNTGTETVDGDKKFTGNTNFTGQTTLKTGNYGLRVTTAGVQKTSDNGVTWTNI